MRSTIRLEDLPPDIQRKLRSGNEKQARQRTKYEAAVADLKLKLRALGLPLPVREFQFAKEAMGRRWAFDFCWIPERVALECQGGIWVAGRHSRGSGLLKEHEKLNAAAQLGYRITYCLPKTVNAPETIAMLEALLTSSQEAA